MVRKVLFGLVPAVALMAMCTSTLAGDSGACEGGCVEAGAACGTKTVYQRQYVTEMRPVTCT
ncbi:MAG: hypothetical protein NTY25_06070, partial [Planctomycetia bacterium]|nr:hypothetical protein [Planctomycetia bacterium]